MTPIWGIIDGCQYILRLIYWRPYYARILASRVFLLHNGGVPLASSRDSLSGPDWKDVAQAIVNYEHFNQHSIEIQIFATVEGGRSDMIVRITARGARGGDQEAKVLVCTSASVRSINHKSLSAIILKCLHDYDVASFENDLPKAAKKRMAPPAH